MNNQERRRALRGLYAITPDHGDTISLVAAVDAVLAGGARLLQYRRKLTPAAARAAEAAAVLVRCRAHAVPLIVNDDAALAAAIGADGVHLGRDDGDVAAARARLGARAIIGVSCYDDLDRARAAVDAGADYVAFGSVMGSPRKPHAPRASLALLRTAAATLPVPVCAIGGITRADAADLVDTGVGLLAVIGDLFDRPDPGAAAAAYRDVFDA